MKTKTLYTVREFIGSEYSRQLGRRLRNRPEAQKIAKALKKAGRTVFLAPIKVAA